MNPKRQCTLAFVINVDWYFDLHWLQRALAAKEAGYNVHLIMAFTNQAIFTKLTGLGFACHAWEIERKSLNPFFNLKGFLALRGLLKTIAPDIIHAITIKSNIYVGLLAHQLKVPYVLSVTGTGTIFSGQSLLVRLVRPVIRGLYKSAWSKAGKRKIIFENGEDRGYFVTTGLCAEQDAVLILGAGVNTDIFLPVPEPITDKPVILFAARLLWDKGLGDLVAAAKLLRDQGLNFEIQVAGIIDNDTMNAIDETVLQDWHQQGWINWLGTVKDMPNLIAQANIVTLPSFYGEGVPRILIEAASCQRASVTTDMPGCREIVKNGENGLLVPAQNVPELAKALAQLLQNPELRKRMGIAGRAMVERDYSERYVIAQTLALYEGLLT